MEISIVHEQQAMPCPGLEELLIGCPNPPPPPPPPEKKPRPQPEQALKCPRCNSTNTKFCYYNNYSLSQPRYFCKSCRRYWTRGGSLRNVPVGGGCRKSRRSSSSSSSSSPSSSSNSILPPSKRPLLDQTSFFSYNHGDLTLAFATQLWPSLADQDHFFLQHPNPNSGTAGAFLNLMKNATFLEPSNNINGFHQIPPVEDELEGSNRSSAVDSQIPNGVLDGALAMECSQLAWFI